MKLIAVLCVLLTGCAATKPMATDGDTIYVQLGSPGLSDMMTDAQIVANDYCRGRGKAAHMTGKGRKGMRGYFVYRCQ